MTISKYILTLIILIIYTSMFSQDTWLITDLDPFLEIPLDILEDEDGSFVYVTYGGHEGGQRFSTIERLDSDGEVLQSTTLNEDSLRYHFYTLNKVNGNYLVTGSVEDYKAEIEIFGSWLFNDKLELIDHHFYDIEEEMWISITLPIDNNETIVCVNTHEWHKFNVTAYNHYYLFKLDSTGVLIDSVKHKCIGRNFQNLTLERSFESDKFIGIPLVMKYTKYDFDFNIIENKEHDMRIAGVINTGCLKQFTDSTYVYGGTLLEHTWSDFDMGIALLDKDMKQINFTKFSKYPSSASSIYQSIDWVDKSAIYFGGAGDKYDNGPTESINLVLVKLDENLGEIWTKYYGSNTPITSLGILATQDGGCIIIATKNKTTIPNLNRTKYILKVDGDGILATQDTHRSSDLWSITSYPNPSMGSYNINLEGHISQASLMVYNQMGQLITQRDQLSTGMNQFDFSELSSGIYHISIIKDGLVIGSEQWVKE